MLAVVLCLRGRSAKLAADFLQGKNCRTAIALGPGFVIPALGELDAKGISPAMVVTDSEICLKTVRASTAHNQAQTVYWGEGADQLAKGLATVVLSEHADLVELAQTLHRLALGLPPDANRYGTRSRLRHT